MPYAARLRVDAALLRSRRRRDSRRRPARLDGRRPSAHDRRSRTSRARRSRARVRPALRASREDVLAVAEGRSGVQFLETQRDGTYAQRDRDIPNAIRLSASDLLEDARGGRRRRPRDARGAHRRRRPRPHEAHDRVVRQRRRRIGRLPRAARRPASPTSPCTTARGWNGATTGSRPSPKTGYNLGDERCSPRRHCWCRRNVGP